MATRDSRFVAGPVGPQGSGPLGEIKPRLGDYILVARLSEDALGTVYRAVHARDGRFARLRVLESAEVPRGAVLSVIQRRDAPHRARSFHPPGRRETLGIAEGHPFLAWNETNGWTLDTILAAARRAQSTVPVEGALKIAIGAAAALEHARGTLVGGEPTRHGLLWPGFVTVSRNTEVWVRGFGLAPAVLPSLREPRLERLIGPYLAPEARDGVSTEASDVYSIGVLLLELLTGRAPSLEAPPAYEPDDPFSADVARLARSAVAPPDERVHSVTALRESLQQILDDSPYERSNADLALFLDDLLAPDRARARRPRSSVWRPLIGATDSDADEPGASRAVWALRIAAAIGSLAALAALDLAVHRREAPRPVPAVAVAARPAAPRSQPQDLPRAETASPAPALETADALTEPPAGAIGDTAPRAGRRARSTQRHAASELAQAWRLRAALSRVSAQTFDAWNLASESFRAGKVNEREGERLLARRLYAAAHEAFERAAELYSEAEEISHEERARVIRVSSLESHLAPPQRF